MLKKFLIWTFIAIVVIVAVFAGVVAMQPAAFRVTRSASFSAPATDVFAQVNDFHNWGAWSPWTKLDPNAKNTFEGPSAGPGAIFKWAGNDEVGEGRMKITESRPNEFVKIELEFIKPYPSSCTIGFTFKPNADQTAVTWTMNGENDFMSKAFCLFMDMDKMIGTDFDKGLANMKAVVEAPAQSNAVKTGYAPVNDLKIYYEIHGSGRPLVLLHGGGSTIDTSFGKVLPALAKSRQVIAFEQQGHGRTADVDRPYSFEQSADDTAALLQYLKIDKADFYGYSNGGNIALQMAIRHPKLVRKLVVASAMFKRDGLYPELMESLKHASPDNMPTELREAYLKMAPNPGDLPKFVARCAQRMLDFKDWPNEDIQGITAPTLVLVGDADIVRPEHAVEIFRLLPHGQLAILPGVDHMTIIKRDDLLLPVIPAFLDAPMPAAKSTMEKGK